MAKWRNWSKKRKWKHGFTVQPVHVAISYQVVATSTAPSDITYSTFYLLLLVSHDIALSPSRPIRVILYLKHAFSHSNCAVLLHSHTDTDCELKDSRDAVENWTDCCVLPVTFFFIPNPNIDKALTSRDEDTEVKMDFQGRERYGTTCRRWTRPNHTVCQSASLTESRSTRVQLSLSAIWMKNNNSSWDYFQFLAGVDRWSYRKGRRTRIVRSLATAAPLRSHGHHSTKFCGHFVFCTYFLGQSSVTLRLWGKKKLDMSFPSLLSLAVKTSNVFLLDMSWL